MFDFPSYEEYFYDIGRRNSFQSDKITEDPNLVYTQKISLHDQYILHSRSGYGMLEIIGDLGGVMEVFLFCLAIIVRPFAVFSFNMKALQKMFLAKTFDNKLFK